MSCLVECVAQHRADRIDVGSRGGWRVGLAKLGCDGGDIGLRASSVTSPSHTRDPVTTDENAVGRKLAVRDAQEFAVFVAQSVKGCDGFKDIEKNAKVQPERGMHRREGPYVKPFTVDEVADGDGVRVFENDVADAGKLRMSEKHQRTSLAQ
jgi:hypothetical protein